MEEIAAEVSQKLKSAIKAKLMELGAYVDDELSNYVMVMVTNRRSKADMDRELQLFLGASTCAFTSWLQSVWMKLEQVTVTNSGIETGKRKTGDKKKKAKKLSKSSSESEDDKKHKKKRKSSSGDVAVKDAVKKRKIALKSGSESNKADSGTDTKKSKKGEIRLNIDTDSETEERIENIASKMASKDMAGDSVVDEDDFLNIKEDFESEFLSDGEISENPKTKAPSSEEVPKKIPAPKLETETTVSVVPAKRVKESSGTFGKAIDQVREAADRAKIVSNAVSKSIPNETNEKAENHVVEKPEKTSTTRKPLIRDRKLRSPPKSKSRRHSRSPSLSRSRSRSVSPTKVIVSRRHASDSKSPARDLAEDFNTKIQRSRMKSAALSSSSSLVKATSRSRSRSPLRSATGKNLNSQEKSPTVMDARELINRKRAMSQATEHSSNSKEDRSSSRRLLSTRVNVDANTETTVVDELPVKQRGELGTAKTTVSGGKMIRLRGRDKSKENCVVDNNIDEDDVKCKDGWVEIGGGDNAMRTVRRNGDGNSKYGRFVVSKSEGKRSVIVQPTAKSPPPGNRKIDLRDIKRTVYIEDDGGGKSDGDAVTEDDVHRPVDSKDEKVKARKCVVNQIVKYIKDEPTVSSTVVKLPKPTRPKMTAAQSASSTLIRKAVADAHKSLTGSKEESSKKKETQDSKSGIASKDRIFEGKNGATTELQISDDDGEEFTEQKETELENDERLSPKSYKSEDERIDDSFVVDDKTNSEHSNNVNEAEEYDPSLNMPQFVVTLTGLDSKLYTHQDVDDLSPNFNDEFMDTAGLDDNKVKPKLQERCKYYPNCLAGDQCLFYHPTIPCKLFPNCKYGNNCLYVHPKCKFDSHCTRYDCTFLHTTPRIAAPVAARHAPPPTIMNGQPCKFYYNCVNPVCPFQHPKICRFDRFCTNKNCTFSHTSLSHVSTVSMDKLRWSRPKENDISKTTEATEPVTNENH